MIIFEVMVKLKIQTLLLQRCIYASKVVAYYPIVTDNYLKI